jgi:hypothetical protein
MRPTRRGAVVAAATVAAFGVAAAFGQPGLNAVAAPGVVALLVGTALVWRADRPAVERRAPDSGFPGDRGAVEVTVDAPGPTTLIDWTGERTDAPVPGIGSGPPPSDDASEDGLALAKRVHRVGGGRDGPDRLEYPVELRERGDHALGPLTAAVTDPLGLVARRYGYDDRRRVLVYPELRPITAGGPLAEFVEGTARPDRQTFDSLREYVRGDALRDVHWKATAKQDDLVVVNFASESQGAVTVVAETVGSEGGAGSSDDRADAMASATASVVVHLLDAGVEVELVVPGGHLEAGVGERQRRAALALLARAPAGAVDGDAAARADVHVRAGERTTVEVAGRRLAFDALAEGASAPGSGRGDREVAA